MGRGIDFKGVNMVLNYDFPPSAVSYIHRIGIADMCENVVEFEMESTYLECSPLPPSKATIRAPYSGNPLIRSLFGAYQNVGERFCWVHCTSYQTSIILTSFRKNWKSRQGRKSTHFLHRR